MANHYPVLVEGTLWRCAICGAESEISGENPEQLFQEAHTDCAGTNNNIPVREPLTHKQFLDLFTYAELIAFKASTDPVVEILLWKEEQAEEIRLDDPEIINGLNYMVATSLLTQERLDEILA
jgi:hypothetical protein